MFAARAPKGGVSAKSSQGSNGTLSQHKGHKGHSATLDHTKARSTLSSSTSPHRSSRLFTSFATGSDSETTWTPIHADWDDGFTQQTPRLGDGASIDEDSIYSKNDQTLVAYFGPLPREVDEVLKNADFYTEPMYSKLDFDSGFGIVVSKTKCYIWAVQKDVTYRSPPMCISLPMPPNSYTSVEASVLLPVVTITNSDDQKSGILACSPDGTCWYWNNIDLSLSDVNQHVDTKINLAQNDCVTHVEYAGPMGYYFGSRYAGVYHISVKKQYGSPVLVSTALHGKVGGAIASIYSMIGIAQGPDTSQKIRAMTSGPKIHDPNGRWDLYALTQRSLHRWHLGRSGDFTQDAEIPLKEKVTERIMRDYSARLPLGSDPEVRLLDIEYIKNGKLLLLVTFFDTADKYATTPLCCALFTLTPQFGPTIEIDSVKYIHRTIEEDLRPQATPRLAVPKGGPGVYIVMPKAVIISSTLPQLDFEDLVPLKTDKIIGYGTEDWRQRGLELEDSSELPIVCRTSGRLGINVQLDESKSPSLSSSSFTSGQDLRTAQELLTEQLQAKLEQAVFFGKVNNPISFDLTHYDGGDLNQASLNVSKEIMKSYAALLGSGKDLTSRLWERYQRIKSIIDNIQAAGMANRLSIDTRFQLCWGAEKLAAANALWSQYQLKMVGKNRHSTSRTNLKQIMDDAASQSLRKLGTHATTEDPISFFMTYHVDHLAELLSSLQRAVARLTLVSDGQHAELIRDLNKILVLSLRSAWNYRKQNVANYALQSTCSLEPWTGAEKIIKALTAQYKETLSICKKNLSTSDSDIELDGPSYLTSELQDQLCDLADVTLQAYSERLQYLEGLTSSSGYNVTIATAVDTYDKAKSELLIPLVELKKTQPAIQLAQRYKDFITLVKLSVGQEKQIDNYISKYQQEFANALFQWYYDNNQLSTLLDVGEKYSDLFTVYLDNRDYGEIAWLHDIKIQRFVEASQRVQDGAILETDLNRRKTMLSLSKLLFMAGVSQQEKAEGGTGGVTSENMMQYASRNNEELEMATVQAMLADEWDRKVGTLASVHEKAQAVVKTFGSSLLPEQPILRKAMLISVQTLLSRQAISSEDFVDILMLQQQAEIQNLDICDVALNICLHSSDIPQNRRPYVLQDIWRRVFIAGSVENSYWKLEDVSDQEAREKLMGSWMCRAYAAVERGGRDDDLVLLRPQDARCTMPAELFKQRFSGGGSDVDMENGEDEEDANTDVAIDVDRNYKAMIRDYGLENEELERRIRDGQLLEKWERVKQIVKEEAAQAAGGRGVWGDAVVSASQDTEMQDADME
ncbi:hypothetical protein EDD11_003558 [Mortierella claussenii]|nr:hypothetical protein EDD11_003558 [Mortierella claussenii]